MKPPEASGVGEAGADDWIYQPLSAEERAVLNGWLVANTGEHGTRSLVMLHGYLTALTVSPFTIEGYYEDYFAPMLDRDGDWIERAKENARADWYRLLVRFEMESVGPPDADEEGPTQVFTDFGLPGPSGPGAWCGGFMHATDSDPEEWLPFFDDPETDEAAMALLYLGAPPDLVIPQPEGEDPLIYRQRMVERLPEFMAGINNYWSGRYHTPPSTVRRKAEPGRNEPCSCGSGKKFKKCCGG